jgi:hypothetical protein
MYTFKSSCGRLCENEPEIQKILGGDIAMEKEQKKTKMVLSGRKIVIMFSLGFAQSMAVYNKVRNFMKA